MDKSYVKWNQLVLDQKTTFNETSSQWEGPTKGKFIQIQPKRRSFKSSQWEGISSPTKGKVFQIQPRGRSLSQAKKESLSSPAKGNVNLVHNQNALLPEECGNGKARRSTPAIFSSVHSSRLGNNLSFPSGGQVAALYHRKQTQGDFSGRVSRICKWSLHLLLLQQWCQLGGLRWPMGT